MHIILAFGGHSSSLQTFLFILVCVGKREHLERPSSMLRVGASVLQFGLPLAASQAGLPKEIALNVKIVLEMGGQWILVRGEALVCAIWSKKKFSSEEWNGGPVQLAARDLLRFLHAQVVSCGFVWKPVSDCLCWSSWKLLSVLGKTMCNWLPKCFTIIILRTGDPPDLPHMLIEALPGISHESNSACATFGISVVKAPYRNIAIFQLNADVKASLHKHFYVSTTF